jgi:aminoglycoside phosphotransferase (APT) family kinase protein
LPVVEWLQQRRETVPCDQPAPIHFDFHPANVMLRPDETAVVLDWSWFDISDARFDLAWTLVLVSSYEGSSWRDRILQTYEQVNGAPVEQIEYFEVYACMRRLFSIVASITGGAEKMGLDPNAVESMKGQVFSHHWVYDLLIERTGIHIPEVAKMLAMIS